MKVKSIFGLIICMQLLSGVHAQLISCTAVQDLNSVPFSKNTCGATSDNYMIYSYDDGMAENYCAWQQAGNMNAVKFILHEGPAAIEGARVYVGTGTFPVGGSILNQPFRVSVYANDGENGMPGSLLDSISSLVTNYEWVTVTGIHAFVISDFYIVITQLSNGPDCIPTGVDETGPKANQSYSRNIMANQPWALSPYQDMMINALISTNVGIVEQTPGDGITISPVPADETAHFEFPSLFKYVSIANSCGQNIFTRDVSGQSSLSVNTSNYQAGIYFASFTSSGGESLVRKWVVGH